jgi:threonine dehydratase
MSDSRITIEAVREAAGRIGPFVHLTPVQTCATISGLAGREVFFKCELFQKVGAFKFRGACNAVFKLTDAEAARGVVTQSSGNHAQALALAAKLRGIAAHIVMPTNTAAAKVNAVREYGARVILCEPTLKSREETADRVAQETGGIYVPPYNHPHVMAGQGTVALEFLEQVPDLDAIVAPVGGGGLISGLCVAGKAVRPELRVFAGEPAGADDAFRSKQAGRLIPQEAPQTIADGLRTSLGDLTWPFVRDVVERVIPVGENEIVQAMRLMWERAKLMIEPSSAVAVAAVLTDEFKNLGDLKRVGVVLTGGNADLDHLPW